MGLTLTEKILARACGRESCSPGEIVEAPVDLAMLHDVGVSGVLGPLAEIGVERLHPAVQVVVIPDHFTPAPTVRAAENLKAIREFARRFHLEGYLELGRSGICHQVLAEKGLVTPGRFLIGTDSHTPTGGALGALAIGVGFTDMALALASGKLWLKVPPTVKVSFDGRLRGAASAKDLALFALQQLGPERLIYKALELAGTAVEALSVEGRMCLCNMAAELGVKNCLVAFDETTAAWLAPRVPGPLGPVLGDADARYQEELRFDVSALEPLVACPSSPFDVRPARALQGRRIDQAFLGSCTNGRLEDLRAAAAVLRGRKVHPEVRMIVTPASQETYLAALKEGLLTTFLEAGAVVTHATCGACVGGHLGLLAAGEVCISSSNRNYRGRMGSPEAEIYLASPATVAASAVQGSICAPPEPTGGREERS